MVKPSFSIQIHETEFILHQMRPLRFHLRIMALINTLSAHENDGKQVTGGFDKSAAKINRFFSGKSYERFLYLKQLQHVNLLHLNHYWQLVCVRKVAAGSNYR